jgi:ribosomal protein L40E
MKLGKQSTDPSRGIRCEHCGVFNPEGAGVCRGCHQPLGKELSVRTCPQCGVDNPLSAVFCMNCGAEISEARPIGQPTLPMVQPVAKLVLPTMREIVISDLEMQIGRADFLEDMPPEDVKFISREHFRIIFEDGKYYILDENSTNGTKLNSIEIKGKRELNDTDRIILANTVELKFRIG